MSMKAVVVVKVDGGYLMYPDEVIVLERSLAEGKFTGGINGYDAWAMVEKLLDYQEVEPVLSGGQGKEDGDELPF